MARSALIDRFERERTRMPSARLDRTVTIGWEIEGKLELIGGAGSIDFGCSSQVTTGNGGSSYLRGPVSAGVHDRENGGHIRDGVDPGCRAIDWPGRPPRPYGPPAPRW